MYLLTDKRKMAHAITSKGKLSLLGGELCLDFVNTVDWRTGNAPEEYLTSYSDIIEWSASVGTIDRPSARRLRRKALADKTGADKAHERAITLRESLYAILKAISTGESAPPKSLDEFNQIFCRLSSRVGIAETAADFEWIWSGAGDDPERPLWPIAVSAFELLISGRGSQVRQCGDPACGWLFVDKSKSHRRQWCSMRVCGNRAKARRHYERTRLQA